MKSSWPRPFVCPADLSTQTLSLLIACPILRTDSLQLSCWPTSTCCPAGICCQTKEIAIFASRAHYFPHSIEWLFVQWSLWYGCVLQMKPQGLRTEHRSDIVQSESIWTTRKISEAISVVAVKKQFAACLVTWSRQNSLGFSEMLLL